MARRLRESTLAEQVLEAPDASVVDLLDHLLTKGVMANGDLTLGVAGVDLIYLRLATVLSATDRVAGAARSGRPIRRRSRRRDSK